MIELMGGRINNCFVSDGVGIRKDNSRKEQTRLGVTPYIL